MRKSHTLLLHGRCYRSKKSINQSSKNNVGDVCCTHNEAENKGKPQLSTELEIKYYNVICLEKIPSLSYV